MDFQRMVKLNEEYEPLRSHAISIAKTLKGAGFICTWGFFAQHSVKQGEEWFFEHYPIPVIGVESICEIGLDIPHTFVECKMKREEALAFDFSRLSSYQFEVYGVQDYLSSDFYNAQLTIADIHKRISQSMESEIGICLYLKPLAGIEELIAAIHLLKSFETYT
jgi:hypothetical protein